MAWRNLTVSCTIIPTDLTADPFSRFFAFRFFSFFLTAPYPVALAYCANPDERSMINQRHCPFCKANAADACRHLALAVEGRDFVDRCIQHAQAQGVWRMICQQQRELHRMAGAPEQEDFMWLETAFCDRFLRRLSWFGGMDYEWRTGPRLEQGGFWVLLWSKDPQHLWWELRDELERRSVAFIPPPEPASPWLWLMPR